MLVRIHVSGCGIPDISGKYDVCNEHAKFPVIGETKGTSKVPGKEIRPDFMYWHIANGSKKEYGIYLQPIPEMGHHKPVWVIAHIGTKQPMLYYYCEQTTGNIPPENGWKLVGGSEPAPKIKAEFMDNPILKAHPPVEVDQHRLEEAMFGHPNYKISEKGHTNNLQTFTKHENVTYQSKPKFIVQQPPCSDMLRSVNEFK